MSHILHTLIVCHVNIKNETEFHNFFSFFLFVKRSHISFVCFLLYNYFHHRSTRLSLSLCATHTARKNEISRTEQKEW